MKRVYQYDAAGRLTTQIEQSSAGTPVMTMVDTYDAVGNVQTITDNVGTASRVFTYDDLNRLETATGTFGPGQSQQNFWSKWKKK